MLQYFVINTSSSVDLVALASSGNAAGVFVGSVVFSVVTSTFQYKKPLLFSGKIKLSYLIVIGGVKAIYSRRSRSGYLYGGAQIMAWNVSCNRPHYIALDALLEFFAEVDTMPQGESVNSKHIRYAHGKSP